MPDFGRWTSNGGDPSLNEINRADRFIDALSTTQPVYSTDAEEAELAFLFSDWRDDVRSAPITAPVTDRDAAVALDGATSRRRSRGSLALVGSVAAAMLCVGGFGAAVYGSGPGDSLYGMRSSLFGTQQATRDDQVSLASAQLQQVQQLIDQGQWEQAQDKLVEVSSAVQNVDAVESKQDLVEQWNALTYKVVEQNPAATLPPGEPLPVLPSSPLTWLPVPVVETTTSTSTVTSETTTGPTTTGSSVTTEPSDGSVPPDVLLTPPPEGSTVPSTAPTTTPTTAPPPTTPQTTPPPTTSTPAPSSTTTTAVTSATTTTTTTTTATAATPPASAPPASAPPPAAAASSPKPQAPTSEPVSSPPKAPTTTSVTQEVQSVESGEGAAGSGVVTTTVVPPR